MAKLFDVIHKKLISRKPSTRYLSKIVLVIIGAFVGYQIIVWNAKEKNKLLNMKEISVAIQENKNDNSDLIEKFYAAFKILDAEAMANCYHEEVVFEDPAFGILKGTKAKNMWRMLCAKQKGKDFKISYSNISFANGKGKAHWEAHYTFGKTERKVYNIIDAEFEFKEGKIIKHTDNFNLYRWSQQAIGTTGYVIGWTSFFKKKLQSQTNSRLTKYEESL